MLKAELTYAMIVAPANMQMSPDRQHASHVQVAAHVLDGTRGRRVPVEHLNPPRNTANANHVLLEQSRRKVWTNVKHVLWANIKTRLVNTRAKNVPK
jgi:hypothetical protein